MTQLVALCLSGGGVGFSSDTMYVHFTTTSPVLRWCFEAEVRKFSDRPIHEQTKPRGLTLRVFDRPLVDVLLQISPSYRTRPCNHFPVCPVHHADRPPRGGNPKHFAFEGAMYAHTRIPPEIFPNRKRIQQFLRMYWR